MACLSCAERAEALKTAAKAVTSGDLQIVQEQAKVVAVSVQRDVTNGFRAAVNAARSRLGAGR